MVDGAVLRSAAGHANERSAVPFEGFEALRNAHLELMHKPSSPWPDSDQPPRTTDQIREFVGRACATGIVIADRAERKAAQGILDYWSAELISAPGASPDDFSPVRLAQPDTTKAVMRSEAVAPPLDPELQVRSREIIRLAAAARQYRDSGKQRGYLLFGSALKEASKYRNEDPNIAELIKDSEEREQRLLWLRYTGALSLAAVLSVLLVIVFVLWRDEARSRAAVEIAREAEQQQRELAERQGALAQKYADNAEQTAAHIQDAIQLLVDEAAKQISNDPYSAGASSLLSISTNLLKLAGGLSRTPERDAARINLMLSVADIYVSKADPGEALALALQAEELSKQLVKDNPNSGDAHFLLYRSAFRVGDAQATIDYNLALPEYEIALQSAQR